MTCNECGKEKLTANTAIPSSMVPDLEHLYCKCPAHAMTKPSYEERRIAKHSASPQIADSASGTESSSTAKEIRRSYVS